MMQMHRRSLTVRCSLETAEVISRVAQLIGWSEGKIAAHLLDRAVPILMNACGEEDLMTVLRILREGAFSPADRPRATTNHNDRQQGAMKPGGASDSFEFRRKIEP